MGEKIPRREALKLVLRGGFGMFLGRLPVGISNLLPVDRRIDTTNDNQETPIDIPTENLTEDSVEFPVAATNGEEVITAVTEEFVEVPFVCVFSINSLPNMKDGSVLVRVEFSNYHEVEKASELESGDFPIESLTFHFTSDTIQTEVVDTFENGDYAEPQGTLSKIDPNAPFELRIHEKDITRAGAVAKEYKLSIQQDGFPLIIIPLSIEENGLWYAPGPVTIGFGAKATRSGSVNTTVSEIKLEK